MRLVPNTPLEEGTTMEPRTPNRRRRITVAGLLAIATIAGPLATTSSASSQTASLPVNITGSTGTVDILNTGDTLICDECIPDSLSPLPGATGWGGSFAIQTEADFVSAGQLDLTVDDAELEEGADASLLASLDPGTGSVLVTATWSGAFGFFNDDNDTDDNGDGQLEWVPVESPVLDGTYSDTIQLTSAAPCDLPAPGQAPVTCTADFGDITLAELPIIPLVVDVDLRLTLSADVTVDATGATTVREVRVDNGPSVDSGSISWTGSSAPMTASDQLTMPCGPVGKDVLADVGATDYDAVVDISEKVAMTIVLDLPTPPFSDIDWELAPLAFYKALNNPVSLTGTGGTATLGTLRADTTAPNLSLTVPPTGAEGDAIGFQATATDACSTPTVDWHLSDGSSMFGTSVTHVFADDGAYTGEATATDGRGNTTTKQFALPISNVAPLANAGPDHSTLWGVPVHFGGSATDPGSADLASMAYAWTSATAPPARPVGRPSTTPMPRPARTCRRSRPWTTGVPPTPTPGR